jgi:hypothetical protein
MDIPEVSIDYDGGGEIKVVYGDIDGYTSIDRDVDCASCNRIPEVSEGVFIDRLPRWCDQYLTDSN